jgi:hypothetical protein
MKNEDLLKIAVIIVVLLFLGGLFSWFRPTATVSNEEQKSANTTSLATGYAIGQIQRYSKELYIEPWNNFSDTVKQLQMEGKLDYINVIGNRGVLFLTANANEKEIRDIFAAKNVLVFGEATIVFPEGASLRLENGTMRTFPLEPIKRYIDPFTRPGDKITFEVIADVTGDSGGIKIKNFEANPIADMDNFTISGALNCTNRYGLQAEVPWEERKINAGDVAKTLNISELNVKYTVNDRVLFSRLLSVYEFNEIRNKNISYISDLTYEGFTTNITDSDKIKDDLTFILTTNDTNASNLSLIFSPSNLVAIFDSEDSHSVEESVERLKKALILQNVIISQKCELISLKIKDSTEKEYILSRENEVIYRFVPIDKIEEQFQATMIARHIGRIITAIDKIMFGSIIAEQ